MYTVFDPCKADTARKTEAYQPDFWSLQSVGTIPDYAEWKVDVLCCLPEIPDPFLISFSTEIVIQLEEPEDLDLPSFSSNHMPPISTFS